MIDTPVQLCVEKNKQDQTNVSCCFLLSHAAWSAETETGGSTATADTARLLVAQIAGSGD